MTKENTRRGVIAALAPATRRFLAAWAVFALCSTVALSFVELDEKVPSDGLAVKRVVPREDGTLTVTLAWPERGPVPTGVFLSDVDGRLDLTPVRAKYGVVNDKPLSHAPVLAVPGGAHGGRWGRWTELTMDIPGAAHRTVTMGGTVVHSPPKGDATAPPRDTQPARSAAPWQ